MQIFKIFNVFPLVFFIQCCYILCMPMPAWADDTAEIAILKTKIDSLNKEISDIKKLLDENASNDKDLTKIQKEIVLKARDSIMLTVGKSSLTLSKSGIITLDGATFNVKNSKDQEIRGGKITNN